MAGEPAQKESLAALRWKVDEFNRRLKRQYGPPSHPTSPTESMRIRARDLIRYWRAVKDIGEPHTNLEVYHNVLDTERELARVRKEHATDPHAVACWFGYWVVMQHPFGDCNHRTSQRAIYALMEQAGFNVDSIPWKEGAEIHKTLDQNEPAEINRERMKRYLTWLRATTLSAATNPGFERMALRSASTSASVGSTSGGSLRTLTSTESNQPEGIKSQRLAVMMMGLPAAGKSTLVRKRHGADPTYLIIDPDEYSAGLPGYDPKRPELVHAEGAKLAEADWQRAIAAKDRHIIFDGTGTKAEKLVRRMKEAKAAGYRVKLLYVVVPLEVSITRNLARDRTVPESLIREKAAQINETFETVRPHADEIEVVDNSRAQNPRLEIRPEGSRVRERITDPSTGAITRHARKHRKDMVADYIDRSDERLVGGSPVAERGKPGFYQFMRTQVSGEHRLILGRIKGTGRMEVQSILHPLSERASLAGKYGAVEDARGNPPSEEERKLWHLSVHLAWEEMHVREPQFTPREPPASLISIPHLIDIELEHSSVALVVVPAVVSRMLRQTDIFADAATRLPAWRLRYRWAEEWIDGSLGLTLDHQEAFYWFISIEAGRRDGRWLRSKLAALAASISRQKDSGTGLRGDSRSRRNRLRNSASSGIRSSGSTAGDGPEGIKGHRKNIAPLAVLQAAPMLLGLQKEVEAIIGVPLSVTNLPVMLRIAKRTKELRTKGRSKDEIKALLASDFPQVRNALGLLPNVRKCPNCRKAVRYNGRHVIGGVRGVLVYRCPLCQKNYAERKVVNR